MAYQNYLPGIAGIGSGLFGLFGKQNNPADEANRYISQIPDKTKQYYDPYFQAGVGQLPQLQDQYKNLLNDPGGKLNQIGQSFQQSPGFKFALEQALQGAGHAAAAGGMAGTPQHEQQAMQLATDLANQDYYNYLQGATGLYGQGLQGSQGLAQMGQQAGQSYADQIAQTLAQQGRYGYEGAAQRNQNRGNAFGQILGGIGSFFGL